MTSRENSQPRARGFASMDRSKQREIASRGGRTAHAQGTAHKFSPEEAREAGRTGGMAVCGDRSHMARIGRRGGQARHARSLAQPGAATRGERSSIAQAQRSETDEPRTSEREEQEPQQNGADLLRRDESAEEH
jgi:general stress protein YciG